MGSVPRPPSHGLHFEPALAPSERTVESVTGAPSGAAASTTVPPSSTGTSPAPADRWYVHRDESGQVTAILQLESTGNSWDVSEVQTCEPLSGSSGGATATTGSVAPAAGVPAVTPDLGDRAPARGRRHHDHGPTVTAHLPATATPDQVVAAMDDQGFAVVEQLLSPEQTAAVRADLTRVLETVPLGRNDFEGHRTKRIYNLFAKTRAFDDIALHPLLLGVLDRVLGHYQFSAPVGIEIGPGEAAQVIHQDDIVYPLPWPHDDVVVNSMWAFDDFTEANGATRVIPGSHHRATAAYPDDLTTVAVEMPAGSVIFYPGTVLHGGGANTHRPGPAGGDPRVRGRLAAPAGEPRHRRPP